MSAHPAFRVIELSDFNQVITGIDITAFVNGRENWNHDSEKIDWNTTHSFLKLRIYRKKRFEVPRKFGYYVKNGPEGRKF